jgi:hypothetical protein
MFLKFNLARRKLYPLGLAIFSAVTFTLLYRYLGEKIVTFVVPITGFFGGLGYFLYSQHLHETKLFIELFRQFNERYDLLNNDLNLIHEEDETLSLDSKQRQKLYDYFNLCAEEHLYFSSGYIDMQVWSAWERGMQFFAKNKRIKRLWAQELQTGSYYSFRPK